MRVRLPWALLLGAWLFSIFQAPVFHFAGQATSNNYTLGLMPVPLHMTFQGQPLRIDQNFMASGQGYWEPRLTRAVNRLMERLSRQTGILWASSKTGMSEQGALILDCGGPGEEVQSPAADESYTLLVQGGEARIRAPKPLGILRGIETFLQLVTQDGDGFYVPGIEIQDRPRFPWRGLLIDPGRHWMPMEVIKRNLDGMAAVKLNVLHWHLSEDQGFRVESKIFPKLHEMGSDGQYYTQDQIREIIDYARDRGIRVMPEFDMPGHTTAWFVGHPELAAAPGPYEIKRTWGVMDPCMDPTREETYVFLDSFIGEMAQLFPDAYFHIGGDEVNGRHWDQSQEIAAFKEKNGLKDNHDLQAYFNRRILEILKKYHKKMAGWDEIFHDDLPKDALIQSWRGQKSLAQTSQKGYQGILSNGYYLDHMLSAGFHYSIDPLGDQAGSLSVDEKARILGGEACMWGEIVTPETIDSRTWPRLAVIAERFWSSQDVTDVEDMYRRMDIISRKLTWLGLQHRANYLPMLERLTGFTTVRHLKVLADIVEPVKFYSRPGTRPYTQQTPLNRLVDAARPESLTARRFGQWVEKWRQNPFGRGEDQARIREQLNMWRINHEFLLPQLEKSGLLREIIPLSNEVKELSEVGLEVLDLFRDDGKAQEAWLRRIVPKIAQPFRPKYELVVPLASVIRGMVEEAFQQKGEPLYSNLDFLDVQTFNDNKPFEWRLNVPGNWEVREENGERALYLLAPGPPGKVRAPTSWALLQHEVCDFVLTGRLRCLADPDNPNRDMVLIFHFQDASHFYYVHFSATSDGLHNIIGLVNGSDRVKINLEAAGRSTARLTDKTYYEFKLTYAANTGRIQAYLGDMQDPILTAQDKTLECGLVGVGSFDDTGSFDNIMLWGKPRR